MNEKITLQDLINLLSEKQGLSKKDAEVFVRNMFELIEEALATEKYVKVKGFGTFKLTEVDSRESVNVNTGERIEIQGHTKVSFTPDTAMKDLINKPFSHFETVILNDDVKLEEMITEGMETPEEIIIPTPVTEEVVQEQEEQQPTVEPEETPTIETPVVEEPVVEEPQKPVVIVETQEETKKEPETPVSTETTPQAMHRTENHTMRILWGIIVVLLLIILFGCYWIFLRPTPNTEIVPTVPTQQETQTVETVQEEIHPDTIATEKDSIAVHPDTLSTMAPLPMPKNDRVASLADTLDYRIVGTKTTYTLKNGESIIKASVRFFGSKMFWPYIVKHNADIIKDADNIPVGAEIKIPELAPRN